MPTANSCRSQPYSVRGFSRRPVNIILFGNIISKIHELPDALNQFAKIPVHNGRFEKIYRDSFDHLEFDVRTTFSSAGWLRRYLALSLCDVYIPASHFAISFRRDLAWPGVAFP